MKIVSINKDKIAGTPFKLRAEMEKIMLKARKATRGENKKYESGVYFSKYNTDVFVYCKAVNNTYPERLRMLLTRDQYMQMISEGIINMEVPMTVYSKAGKKPAKVFKSEAVRIRSNVMSNMYRRRFFAILDGMWDVETENSTHSFGIVEFEFSNAVLGM